MSNLIARLNEWWNRQSSQAQKWLLTLGLLSFYTLVAIVVTWPVVTRLSGGIPGYQDGDQLQKIWSLWYTKEAILHGKNPAYFSTLVYPHGYFSPIRWSMLVIPVMVLPLTLIFSPIAAYNLAFLSFYILTGYTGYLLCQDITSNRRASICGGLVVMLFPVRVAHGLAGHLETGSLFLALLYMRSLRRVLLEPNYRRAILTGVLLGLASAVHVTYLPYLLAPWTAIYVIQFLIARAPRLFDWPTWRGLLITFGVAALTLAPFFVPLVVFSLNPPEQVMEGGTIIFAADVLSYVSPSPNNPLLSALGLVPAFAKEVLAFHPQELLAYLGIVPLVLAGLAVARHNPESKAWLIIALIAMSLALGPYLKVRNVWITFELEKIESLIVLPYAMLTKLPLFGVGRTPGRFNLLTGIALAVLVAQGAMVWLRGKEGDAPAWRSYVLLAAVVILVGEYLVMWPLEMRDSSVPAAVQTLAEESPTGGVLNVPLDNRSVRHQALFYQITHRWPIMDGYVSRTLPHDPGLLETFDWITGDRPKSDIISPVEPDVARALLAEQGVSYVLLHRSHVWEIEEVETKLEAMLGDPLMRDEMAALYRVEPTFAPNGIAYALSGSGWGWAEPWAGESGRWLSQRASLVIYTPHEIDGALSFQALSGDLPRHLLVSINGGEPYTLVIGQHLRYYVPDITLHEGYNVVRFEAQEDCWPVQGDAHCYVNWALTGLPVEQGCWLSAPFERCLDVLFQDVKFTPDDQLAAYHSLEVKTGESIQLKGYSLQEESIQPGASLTLTLIWQALDFSSEDYKFFVHLLDAGSRMPVAQYDGSPLREAYMTTQWQPGDIVQEKIVLHLPADLTPGKYVLLTGMYHYPSLVRLPPRSDRPYAQDGLIWLQDVTVNTP